MRARYIDLKSRGDTLDVVDQVNRNAGAALDIALPYAEVFELQRMRQAQA